MNDTKNNNEFSLENNDTPKNETPEVGKDPSYKIAGKIEKIEDPKKSLESIAHRGKRDDLDIRDNHEPAVIDINEFEGSEVRLDELVAISTKAGLGLVDRESLGFDVDRSGFRANLIKYCMNIDANTLSNIEKGEGINKEDYELVEFMLDQDVQVEAKIAVLMHALIPKEKLSELDSMEEELMGYKQKAIQILGKYLNQTKEILEKGDLGNGDEKIVEDNQSGKENEIIIDQETIFEEIKNRMRNLKLKDLEKAYHLKDIEMKGVFVDDFKSLLKALEIDGVSQEIDEIDDEYLAKELLKAFVKSVSLLSLDYESDHQLDALRILNAIKNIDRAVYKKKKEDAIELPIAA